jgi:hypothetical protein
MLVTPRIFSSLVVCTAQKIPDWGENCGVFLKERTENLQNYLFIHSATISKQTRFIRKLKSQVLAGNPSLLLLTHIS